MPSPTSNKFPISLAIESSLQPRVLQGWKGRIFTEDWCLSLIETKTPHHLDKGHHNSPTQIFMYFLKSASLSHKTIMFVQGTNRWQVWLAYIVSSDLKESSKNPVFQHFRASPLSYWLALTLKQRAKQRGWTPWYPRFRWFIQPFCLGDFKKNNLCFWPLEKKTYKNSC